jgi:hypothetical protein
MTRPRKAGVFKRGDLSRITGVPAGTLSQRFDRKIYKESRRDMPCSGSGTYREFSRATIIGIAISQRLVKLGISAGRAIAAAAVFTDVGNENRAANELFEHGKTVLFHTEHETTIRNVDSEDSLFDLLGRPMTPAILVDIGPIVAEVDNKLLNCLSEEFLNHMNHL